MKKSQNCTFCKVINGELPSTKILETDEFLVFKNIHPKRPIHFLIATKEHYTNMLEAPEDIWGKLQNVIKELVKEYKPKGFRISSNIGKAALMQHMHFHFLAPVAEEDGVI